MSLGLAFLLKSLGQATSDNTRAKLDLEKQRFFANLARDNQIQIQTAAANAQADAQTRVAGAQAAAKSKVQTQDDVLNLETDPGIIQGLLEDRFPGTFTSEQIGSVSQTIARNNRLALKRKRAETQTASGTASITQDTATVSKATVKDRILQSGSLTTEQMQGQIGLLGAQEKEVIARATKEGVDTSFLQSTFNTRRRILETQGNQALHNLAVSREFDAPVKRGDIALARAQTILLNSQNLTENENRRVKQNLLEAQLNYQQANASLLATRAAQATADTATAVFKETRLAISDIMKSVLDLRGSEVSNELKLLMTAVTAGSTSVGFTGTSFDFFFQDDNETRQKALDFLSGKIGRAVSGEELTSVKDEFNRLLKETGQDEILKQLKTTESAALEQMSASVSAGILPDSTDKEFDKGGPAFRNNVFDGSTFPALQSPLMKALGLSTSPDIILKTVAEGAFSVDDQGQPNSKALLQDPTSSTSAYAAQFSKIDPSQIQAAQQEVQVFVANLNQAAQQAGLSLEEYANQLLQMIQQGANQ